MSRQEAIDTVKLLQALIGLADVTKILGTFIAAFEKGVMKADGMRYLHGNFNIGGTVSGRLSSSKPNLQNIPASSTYAKVIKRCFSAPEGWLMSGIDFNSLEDYISALTSKDPNKLKVYLDGYDGHCLRAYSYYKVHMPDIEDTVISINSIATRYASLRQRSKNPTFLLTYGGTYHGLMHNQGLPEAEALAIESNYHELYKVSDAWVAAQLKQATYDGYVTVAFGLRVRTPILKQTLLNTKSTPREAAAESRTAGNALGQSYGLLNNRAGIEFQKRLLASEYRHDIKPIAQIHDAQYFIIRNNLGCIKWFNDTVVECVQWQDLPELEHDTVKLGGGVDIFYPTWEKAIGIPNYATKREILDICS